MLIALFAQNMLKNYLLTSQWQQRSLIQGYGFQRTGIFTIVPHRANFFVILYRFWTFRCILVEPQRVENPVFELPESFCEFFSFAGELLRFPKGSSGIGNGRNE